VAVVINALIIYNIVLIKKHIKKWGVLMYNKYIIYK